MTKFKEYLRAKGIKLECDYEFLPCGYIDGVTTKVMDGCVVAVVYSNCAGAEYAVYDRSGVCSYFDGDGYKAYIEDPHCDPEYIDWLCHTRYEISTALYPVAVCMYKRDEKVRVAFKHMLAGIMSEEVFYKYIVRQYPKYIKSV